MEYKGKVKKFSLEPTESGEKREPYKQNDEGIREKAKKNY